MYNHFLGPHCADWRRNFHSCSPVGHTIREYSFLSFTSRSCHQPSDYLQHVSRYIFLFVLFYFYIVYVPYHKTKPRPLQSWQIFALPLKLLFYFLREAIFLNNVCVVEVCLTPNVFSGGRKMHAVVKVRTCYQNSTSKNFLTNKLTQSWKGGRNSDFYDTGCITNEISF
jgi:hypothetical protein